MQNPRFPDSNSWAVKLDSYGTEKIHYDCPAMLIKDSIKLWLLNKSEQTRGTYSQIICSWLSFIPADKALEPTVRDVYEYLAYLERKPGQKTRLDLDGTFWPTTMRKYITCLRSFYNFLTCTQVSTANPFADRQFSLKIFRVEQKRPTEFIEFDKVESLLLAAGRYKGRKVTVRNAAIIAMLFGTGLRKTEASSLLMRDLAKTERGTWYINLRKTKSKKSRQPALGAWALGPILAYREQRIVEQAQDLDFFFVGYDVATETPSKLKMTPKGMYLVFKNAAKRAGVPFACFHSGRAAVVSKLLFDGAEYREVQEVTGHSSVQMVESYDKRSFGPDTSATKGLRWK